MQFVKIGKRVVNLANVTDVWYQPDGGFSRELPCVIIGLVGEIDNGIVIYKKDEPEAFAQLMTWMNEQPALLTD